MGFDLFDWLERLVCKDANPTEPASLNSEVDQPRKRYKFPDAAPPGDERYDDMYLYLIIGGGYEKKEVEPGKWKWVHNPELAQEIYKTERAYRQKLEDLGWALRTRALSDEELQDVRRYGASVLDPTWKATSGFGDEHRKRRFQIEEQFNAALLRQIQLRIASGVVRNQSS